eukprot:TRINITY_DN2037_c0_g1_i1.p1 TRINITY_DN2037_c0_g1~~TRINITY_DN2037_c0_g1_i1.p1  ORF type:complete len:199 (-),score=54.06 TRINITY_DN2037_c0_g1_i1:36-632(-)
MLQNQPPEQIKHKLKEAHILARELERLHKKGNCGESEQKSREKLLLMVSKHFKELEARLVHEEEEEEEDTNEDDGFVVAVSNKRPSILIDLDAKEFASVLANEEKIDKGLENLHQGVQRLQQLADMTEKEAATATITREKTVLSMETVVEVIEEPDTINRIITLFVTNARSPLNFMIDCLFFIVFVALAIGMYFALTK